MGGGASWRATIIGSRYTRYPRLLHRRRHLHGRRHQTPAPLNILSHTVRHCSRTRPPSRLSLCVQAGVCPGPRMAESWSGSSTMMTISIAQAMCMRRLGGPSDMWKSGQVADDRPGVGHQVRSRYVAVEVKHARRGEGFCHILPVYHPLPDRSFLLGRPCLVYSHYRKSGRPSDSSHSTRRRSWG